MVVYVDGETQKRRLMKRNPELTEEDAVNRNKSQMPLELKAEKADAVIDNNGTIEETVEQIEAWGQANCPKINQ